MSSANQRLPLIDALKAIAAVLVLLNHFSSYGPLAAAAREILPNLVEWCFEYGRMAVQIFLVIAGFLAVRTLSPNGEALTRPLLPLLGKRYLRLVPPYLAALMLAIVAAAITRQWLQDDFIPAAPEFMQLLAHAALSHGLLGVDALSAGVWYIAIDFQLFALMALLLWSGRQRPLAPILVLGLAALSLFVFNRDAGLDNWAIYFFGSYGLGAAAWWASNRRLAVLWLSVMGSIVFAALLLDFRLRILLALGVALLLGLGRYQGFLQRWPDNRVFAFLGRISYSLFLVHFPILMLANGIYARFGFNSNAATLVTLALAGLSSLALATVFHRRVECADPGRLLQLPFYRKASA